MGPRAAYVLVVKPACAVALAAVGASLIRNMIPREHLGGGPLEAVLFLFLASICLVLLFLDMRRPHAAAKHGAISLVAGLVLGFMLVREPGGIQSMRDVPAFDRQIGLAFVVLIAGITGTVVGIARCAAARFLARREKSSDIDPSAKVNDELPTRAPARPWVVQSAVFCAGLIMVLPLLVAAPVVFDSRDVAECLRLGDAAESGSPQVVRSASQLWQTSGVEAMAFSCDGKYLATGGHGGSIGIWNVGDWTRAGELKQEGWVSRLAFSPDGEWLYVAGDSHSRGPVLCRFRWRIGERDREFTGHKKGVDSMALSADGKTLFSSSSLGDDLRMWDTTSGEPVHPFVCRSPVLAYAPRRRLLLEWDRFAGYSNAYLDGVKILHSGIPAKPMDAVFSPDEQLLVVARHLDSAARGPELSLVTFRIGDARPSGLQIGPSPESEVRLPGVRPDRAALAVSPDGRQVAVGSDDARIAIYTMPDLKPTKELHFPVRAPGWPPFLQLVYSPDSRWLVASQRGRTTPRIFDAATAEEVSRTAGTGDTIRDLRFSADGRTLQTVDYDNKVSFWDASNLALRRRFSLPDGCVVGDIRPSDGRYALCCNAVDPARPAPAVVDLDTGKSVCQLPLPLTWRDPGVSSPLARVSSVYWISDREVLCTGRVPAAASGHWWRLDYQTGKVLGEGDPRSIPKQGVHRHLEPLMGIGRDSAEVTEDGKRLFVIGGGGKGSPPDVAGQIDLQTFRATDLGRIDRPANGPFGLVPGGKYFHLGLHIYDRRSLNLVAAKVFLDETVETGLMTFSQDGSHYAALLRHGRGDEARYTVLVHKTLTSRVLTAFTLSNGVNVFRFSQDGTQLAFAYVDGTLELRTLPATQPVRPEM